MLQIAELMPERRIIKCHLPLNLLPPDVLDTAKVVYTTRNPKDAIVSHYKMLNSMDIPEGPISFDAFARLYMDDGLIFAPHWRHVQLAWEQRNHPNLCFVFLEELKTDTKKQLRRLNDFIGTELTESQLDAVEHHTSFKSMKERGEPMKDGLFKNFFRKGATNDWKEYFTPELKADVDKWIEENTSKIGITHKWE
ncbi:sulfotransferase 1A1-like [Eriocheir sinensis]|uniref:sulfotransferase 1A1-like n=1 Tax=Eriocheir sinensis TaxID=95602 RepID=UPI0021C9CE25|nr:sulfotransferase 1A1-like [Eriocheir sinensis]